MAKTEKIVARLSKLDLADINQMQNKYKISKSKIIRMLLDEGLKNIIIHNGYYIDWGMYKDGQIWCDAYDINTKMEQPEIEFNEIHNKDFMYEDNFGTIVNLKNKTEVIEYFKIILNQY
jgi:hypothetical protein